MNLSQLEGNEITEELSKFNFGAFGLGIVWAIFNNVFVKYIPYFIGSLVMFFLLGKIPFIGPLFMIIAVIGVPIYVGFLGNRWVWENNNYTNLDDFAETQRNWAKGAVLFIALAPFIGLWLAGSIFTNAVKDGGIDRIVSSVLVREIVEKDLLSKCETGYDIIRELKKDKNAKEIDTENGEDKNTDEYDDTIFVPSKNSKDTGYVIKIYKNGICSLKQKNCYIEVSRKKSSFTTPTVKTYFDTKGKYKHKRLKKASF